VHFVAPEQQCFVLMFHGVLNNTHSL